MFNFKPNIMNKNVLVGLFAGVAIGATLGILFAPEKGSDTRKKIKDKSSDIKGKAVDKYGQIVDTASQKIDAVKSKFNDLTGRAENVVNGAVENANTTV